MQPWSQRQMDRQIDIQRRSNTPNGLASCQHQQRTRFRRQHPWPLAHSPAAEHRPDQMSRQPSQRRCHSLPARWRTRAWVARSFAAWSPRARRGGTGRRRTRRAPRPPRRVLRHLLCSVRTRDESKRASTHNIRTSMDRSIHRPIYLSMSTQINHRPQRPKRQARGGQCRKGQGRGRA